MEIKATEDLDTTYWERKQNAVTCWYACHKCGAKAPRNEHGQNYYSNFCPACGRKVVLSEEGNIICD